MLLFITQYATYFDKKLSSEKERNYNYRKIENLVIVLDSKDGKLNSGMDVFVRCVCNFFLVTRA